MDSINDFKLTPLYLYTQYSNSELLVDVFKEVSNFIQETYIRDVFEMIESSIRFRNSNVFNNQLIYQYALQIFGVTPPLSGEAVSQFYDTDLIYDKEPPFIFDNVIEGQGAVDIAAIKQILQLLADYSKENFDIQWFVELAISWANVKPLDVEINIQDDSLLITIPPGTEAANFIKVFQANKQSLCLPFGFNIDYKVKS